MQLSQRLFTFLRSNWLLILIIFASVLVFSPALNNFFLGDDWFHLKIVQISSFREFLNFLNPAPNPQSTAFYRPIPNQLFFFSFKTLFGLQAVYYHLFIMGLFVLSLLLFYKVLRLYKLEQTSAIFATAVFAFSHTHFSRLYFLSASQELMMNIFVLLALWKNQRARSTKDHLVIALFFILALLCKENAIVLPGLILLVDWLSSKKIHWQKLLVLGSIAVLYLALRIFVVGFAMTSDSSAAYQLNFSPRLTANTLYFYSLWTVGGAELLQDYMSSPLTLLERFHSDHSLLGQGMIVALVLITLAIALAVLRNIKKALPLLGIFVLSFVLTLLPVLFLPTHKFTIQLSLAVMSFAVFLALLLKKETTWLKYGCLALFLTLNIISIALTSRSHYTIQRAQISRQVYSYLQQHYPTPPANSYFFFANSATPGSDIPTWGSSHQISNALMGSNFFQVFYPNEQVEVYYEDDGPEVVTNKQRIELKSEWFL